MSRTHLLSARLTPAAFALALAFVLPAAARAQAAPAPSPAAAASAAKEVALPAADRARYVGTYLVSVPGTDRAPLPFRVFEAQGSLMGQPEGGQPARLLYQGGHVFRPEPMPEAALTFTVEGERATRFSVATPEGDVQAVRAPDAK